eukprot:4156902-Pyramimonas_sp.AAC.1
MRPDTLQHAAAERWPQYVCEAAVHALTIWGKHGVAAFDPDQERPISRLPVAREEQRGRPTATTARSA